MSPEKGKDEQNDLGIGGKSDIAVVQIDLGYEGEILRHDSLENSPIKKSKTQDRYGTEVELNNELN